MRFIAKTDKNQREIVLALRKIGAKVLLLHQVGSGCPDLAVGYRGRLLLMECKSKNGRLTDDEQYFYREWTEYMVVVYSVEDALLAIGAI
jgi:Holliday junction resolvase